MLEIYFLTFLLLTVTEQDQFESTLYWTVFLIRKTDFGNFFCHYFFVKPNDSIGNGEG